MKDGQVIQNIIIEIFFFKNYAVNDVGGLAPDLLMFLYEVKASGLQFSFNIS